MEQSVFWDKTQVVAVTGIVKWTENPMENGSTTMVVIKLR
jgi:hypothetical protein